MVIEGYEVSKQIDPITARIMNFLHKSNILYTCSEDNNNKVLKYSYLNLCTFSGEKVKKDYYDLLKISLSDYNLSKETSNWTIEYNRYIESIRRKCNWCNIKIDFCPIKLYADLKNYALHNKLSLDALLERLVEEPKFKTINNEGIEKNIANRIVRICKEFASLRLAEVLLETNTVEITDFDTNGNIQFKYIDFDVESDSLINNLYNYYTNMGNIKYDSINYKLMDDLEIKENYPIYKIAAYILYLCRTEKVDFRKVFRFVYLKCGNIAESKFDTYYKWYINQIENLDCDNEVKEQIKEIITYMRNYHIKYEYHLPYVQINLNIKIDDETLLEKIGNIIYKFAISCNYIKEKFAVIDTEFLFSKCEKDIEIVSNIDKMYKDAGIVVIKNLEKVLLSQGKKETFFNTIEGCVKEYSRSITIFATKTDITEELRGYPYLLKTIRHNIQIPDYSVEKIEQKILERLRNNYSFSEKTESNIKEYIKRNYENSASRNNDYIDSLYENIVYNNFNNLNISNTIEDLKIKEENNKPNVIIKNLDELIGLEEVKREVKKFRNLLVFNNKISNRIENKEMNMNMLFLGNPGTGKTTVARIMANILYELGYIKKNKFIDVTAKDLVAEYVGQTAIKTSRIIESALDGVLFIDEAYSIVSQNRTASFGDESIAALVQAMEKYKSRLVVIFAGYTLEMKNFVDSNPGIASRIGYTFEFSNYTTEELIEIFRCYAKEKGFEVEEEAIPEIIDIIERNRITRNFGNARFMINLFERLIMVHAQNFSDENAMTITKNDALNLEKENFYSKKNIDEVYKELNNLVGLNNVKKEIEGLVDLVLLNNKIEKRVPINLNMIFIGNPGTGKTTVARIFAEILYNLGYIKNNKLIEVTGKDLIGEYIGQTSQKTAKVLENALDGLLFIDEAYTLMNQVGTGASYSQDAISTITKYMTDYEGRLTVIFAGYKEEMKDFMELNSGLISRIGETIEFSDYNEEELMQIYIKEVEKSKFVLDEDAKNKILEMIKENKKSKNFGNARFVINMFKKTLMKHAKRCRNIEDMNEIKRIRLEDIPQIKLPKEKRIGF